jgi:hypothetical protein
MLLQKHRGISLKATFLSGTSLYVILMLVQNLRHGVDQGDRGKHQWNLSLSNHFPGTEVAGNMSRNTTTEGSAVPDTLKTSWDTASPLGKRGMCKRIHTSWDTFNGRLVIVPTEGFGNRMRLLAAGIYIARSLQRNLSVVWSGMEELHTARTGSLSFAREDSTASCYVIDCHKEPSMCEHNFRTLTLEQLFPRHKTCILIKSFSPLDKYLLDNANTHAQLMMQRNSFPPFEVFKDFLCTLRLPVRQELCGLGKQLRTGDISFSLHLRTGADPKDGGKPRHLYKPQLRCLAKLQRHFESQNLSSTVFLETDAAFVKDTGLLQSSFGITNVLTLPRHAGRENTKDTLLFWILLHEGDVSLTAYWSSLGTVGAERTGGPLPYALPWKHSFNFVNEGGVEATRECGSALKSTATHDLAHILVPSECTDIFPGCPTVPVDMMVGMVRTWRRSREFISRDWCIDTMNVLDTWRH